MNSRLEKQLQQLAEGCGLMLEALNIICATNGAPSTAFRRLEAASLKINDVRYSSDGAEEPETE